MCDITHRINNPDVAAVTYSLSAMESPSKFSDQKSRPGSTQSERAERGHRPFPKRLHATPTSNVVSSDVGVHPPLPLFINRDPPSTQSFQPTLPANGSNSLCAHGLAAASGDGECGNGDFSIDGELCFSIS